MGIEKNLRSPRVPAFWFEVLIFDVLGILYFYLIVEEFNVKMILMLHKRREMSL